MNRKADITTCAAPTRDRRHTPRRREEEHHMTTSTLALLALAALRRKAAGDELSRKSSVQASPGVRRCVGGTRP